MPCSFSPAISPAMSSTRPVPAPISPMTPVATGQVIRPSSFLKSMTTAFSSVSSICRMYSSIMAGTPAA